MKVIILHNQSILDIALQHTGSVENAFALALANGLSLTDDLAVGNWLIADSQELNANKEILNYYQSKSVQPATAISGKQEAGSQLEGVGYWAIKTEFIIS
ncbi:hypothetical protein [Bergeyella zoohelcum]|uniref:Uncharacterized protein n=1 Tax=Bergeyella zoohelcum TaxID=1015 RepID=A0A380ZUT6_9FLAO|nr:hypothetical protein [Bergeyella zoohelcum]EKB58418.1 hypothetical protein HMPREF9700_01870 [Bergeyella zoohelcum CCUG 30536]SUV53121.1 Uncharacterised protein [Bergeyella zoohelcum]